MTARAYARLQKQIKNFISLSLSLLEIQRFWMY